MSRQQLLSTGQYAKLRGVTSKTVRLWCDTGKLYVRKEDMTEGGQRRINPSLQRRVAY